LLIILIFGNLISIETLQRKREKKKKHLDAVEESEVRIGLLLIEIPNYSDRTESESPLVHTPNIPDPVQQMVETPS